MCIRDRRELTRKASERLVRQMLGDSLQEEVVERLVTQAAGHAFYLEELIRRVASGGACVDKGRIFDQLQYSEWRAYGCERLCSPGRGSARRP